MYSACTCTAHAMLPYLTCLSPVLRPQLFQLRLINGVLPSLECIMQVARLTLANGGLHDSTTAVMTTLLASCYRSSSGSSCSSLWRVHSMKCRRCYYTISSFPGQPVVVSGTTASGDDEEHTQERTTGQEGGQCMPKHESQGNICCLTKMKLTS